MKYQILVLAISVMLCVPLVSAHPGPTDACRGHTALAWVEYPPALNLQPSFPSEPGEYHFHLTRTQGDEAVRSLLAYKQTHPEQTALGIDHGSFTAGGIQYDILEYTRPDQNGARVAILNCADGDILQTGIMRVLVP